MTNSVLYRLPGETSVCHYVDNADKDITVVQSVADIPDGNVFVFAPFVASAETPIVVFNMQGVRDVPIDSLAAQNALSDFSSHESNTTVNAGRQTYTNDFSVFHEALEQERFSKLVLSRSAAVQLNAAPDCIELFLEASRQNPNCFVALVSTAIAGTWLMATPEILLEQKGQSYHTVALAGTQKQTACFVEANGQKFLWNGKNKNEQQLVAQYIRGRLDAKNIPYRESGPTTVKAGQLLHLRSDFVFSSEDCPLSVPQMLEWLHPTPAVCGLPADEAKTFIVEHEHNKREYYSGFCGVIDETAGTTHVYVTLRCMKMAGRLCILYAGGGLLTDSNEADEWNETQNKMQAMLRLLAPYAEGQGD